ncbi:MAG: MBOAT family protein [Subdoligranulum sp.]|nr:MBOAT family protein [Subdoligranulum sp.]
MQFTSFAYVGFFAAVFAVYWAAPARLRWAVGLAASLGFYALFGLPMLAVLALCIAVSYAGGLWLEARRGQKRALALCVLAALLPLLFFKYFNGLFGAYAPKAVTAFSLMMPVGLSFFTFKTVAYLAEVYKGTLDACRHVGQYALYVSFFPQVSMGPIQRPGDLLGQLAAPHDFDAQQALGGAQIVLWGYFEKLVVADNLVYYGAAGFGRADQLIGCSVFLSTVFYAVRLYADFAGYSHIAIGCMRLLGFSVPENFRAPYTAASVREFWNRWHISLSSWLRDYIYIPLGGSRCGTVRTCGNLLVTFLVSGLWHGVGLQFAVWGLLHGCYLVIGRLTEPLRGRLWQHSPIRRESLPGRVVRVAVTLMFVWIGWVFFAADSLPHALTVFARMTDGFPYTLQTLKNGVVMLGFNQVMVLRIAISVVPFFAVDLAARREGAADWLPNQKKWLRLLLCYFALAAILFNAPYEGTTDPIYFQF